MEYPAEPGYPISDLTRLFAELRACPKGSAEKRPARVGPRKIGAVLSERMRRPEIARKNASSSLRLLLRGAGWRRLRWRALPHWQSLLDDQIHGAINRNSHFAVCLIHPTVGLQNFFLRLAHPV